MTLVYIMYYCIQTTTHAYISSAPHLVAGGTMVWSTVEFLLNYLLSFRHYIVDKNSLIPFHIRSKCGILAVNMRNYNDTGILYAKNS